MKVTSTKNGIIITFTSGSRLVNVCMYQICFMTTIDAMLFFREFQEFKRNTQKYPGCTTPEMRLPTESTSPPVHQKNYLAKVHAGPVLQLAKKITHPNCVKSQCKTMLCCTVLYG